MQEEHDDITFEDEQEEASSHLKGKSEKKLRGELRKAVEEKQEYLAGWQRAKADLVNFKKEVEENRQKSVRLATEDLIMELLPVMDSFEMAFRDTKTWEKADENWRKGIEYIYAQLLSILESRGVKQVNPTGEPFDPNLHDSLQTVPVEKKHDDGKVVDVIQRGYTLHDKLIRPAKVHVGEYAE